jgi:hypothetical protein
MSWAYGFVKGCHGKSCDWHARSGTLRLANVGFYEDTVTDGVISVGAGKELGVTGCHFVETSRISYGASATIKFTNCYFSRARPSTYAQFGTTNVDTANIATYASTGFDTYFCPLTAAMATKSGSPVTTPTLHFTNAQMRVKMDIIVFGLCFVPMELVW